MIAILSELFYNKNFLQQLKRTPGMTWNPAIPKDYASFTRQEMLNMIDISVHDDPTNDMGEEFNYEAPSSFDWATSEPACAGPQTVRRQGTCGSCWAFSSVNQLADNRCIKRKDLSRVQYSEQYVVSCDRNNAGCDGGNLRLVQYFLKRSGTVRNSCVPYTSGITNKTGKCPTSCTGSSTSMTKTKSYGYTLIKARQSSIMSALTYGVLQASFTVYEDFYYYDSGIYMHIFGDVDGYHAIEIVGYGEENGIQYWKAKNSWGKTWGESGFFRILRGVGECQIESRCYLMTP